MLQTIMPRKSRIIVPDHPHHIVQRGHNRQAVFASDGDYQYYLENLQQWKEELKCKVYSFCLMTNHIHLLINPGNDPKSLSDLKGTDLFSGQEKRGQVDNAGFICSSSFSLFLFLLLLLLLLDQGRKKGDR